MKLSIIIPVYNNWNFTKSCLKDLAKLPNDHEVILVDNGSNDQTATSATIWDSSKIVSFDSVGDHPASNDIPKNIVAIRNKENLGFAKACNQGFEKARGRYVLFLNNDIRVMKEYETWTQALMGVAEKTDGLVGPNGGLLDDNLGFVRETKEVVKGNFYMSGWCLCAKKSVFDSLVLDHNEYKGPFTEEFVTYFEDTDMGFRAEEAGIPMSIVYVPVVHFGKMTSRKMNLTEMFLAAKRKFVNKWSKRIK